MYDNWFNYYILDILKDPYIYSDVVSTVKTDTKDNAISRTA